MPLPSFRFPSPAHGRRRAALGLALALGAAGPVLTVPAAPLAAQARPAPAAPGGPVSLSLEEALALAVRRAETVRIAEAGTRRARGQIVQARSAYLPQLSASLSYQRQLQNQFQAITERFGDGEEDGGGGPPADTGSGGGSLADNPISVIFASPNTIVFGLQFSQALFAPRSLALIRSARSGADAADIEVSAQLAQAELDATQAYYNALLGDRLVAIAESSLVQTERTYRQAVLARQVGRQSEFELLRARVTRENQRPLVIQARTQRDQAYLRLRQLLEIPLGAPLRLTTDIEGGVAAARQLAQATGIAPSTVAAAAAAEGSPLRPVSLDVDVDAVLAPNAAVRALVDSIVALVDTATLVRAPVRQAAANVQALEAQLRAARYQRLPTLGLQSQYQRFAYPTNGVPGFNDFFPNWTVSVGLSVPVFAGGRIRGDVLAAQANLAEARERLQQTSELAALDAAVAIDALEQAVETFVANLGTVEQAQRAYGIAEVRFTEGISTQLELNDSRLLLQQAQANRAQAARDLAVARVRLALLARLPLGTITGAGAGATAGGVQQFGPAGTGGPQGGAPGGAGAPPGAPAAGGAPTTTAGFTGGTTP